MKKLLIACVMLAAAVSFVGCSATKIEYESGDVKYRIYRNSHWLKTDADTMAGGMSKDGQFTISADGLKSSPSEEFNRVMQTYTTAFIQLAQIAAAAYNPSSKEAVALKAVTNAATTATATATSEQKTETGAQQSSDCTDGSCGPGTATAK